MAKRITRPEHPTTVFWNDAQVFAALFAREGVSCYRLPTAAKWECGARVGRATRYFFRDSDPDVKNAIGSVVISRWAASLWVVVICYDALRRCRNFGDRCFDLLQDRIGQKRGAGWCKAAQLCQTGSVAARPCFLRAN